MLTSLLAPEQAVTCQGIILVSAGAHAAAEQQVEAVPALKRVGPVSRRITGPAVLRGLRGLPRMARLLRIEALVRYHPGCTAMLSASTGLLCVITMAAASCSCLVKASIFERYNIYG